MNGLSALAPGTVFAGDFVVVRALAEGGMGAVYVTRQQSTGKERALKVMHPALAATTAGRERFVQEAQVGAQIDSDHVVEVVAAGVDAATQMPWLAMELLQGEELAARVLRGPLPLDELREVFDQLCDALGKAHARGVVHRDLKPENVFIATARRRGVPFTVKILDFGIAKILKDNQTAATATSAIGSPLWMAPEQGDSVAKLRPATDVWALGLMAFHALTGRSYWRSGNSDAPSLQAILTEVMVSPIVPPSQRAQEIGVGVSLPAGFDEWFLSCVRREPERRFNDANVAWASLSAVLGVGARPSGLPFAPTLDVSANAPRLDLAPTMPQAALAPTMLPAIPAPTVPQPTVPVVAVGREPVATKRVVSSAVVAIAGTVGAVVLGVAVMATRAKPTRRPSSPSAPMAAPLVPPTVPAAPPPVPAPEAPRSTAALPVAGANAPAVAPTHHSRSHRAVSTSVADLPRHARDGRPDTIAPASAPTPARASIPAFAIVPPSPAPTVRPPAPAVVDSGLRRRPAPESVAAFQRAVHPAIRRCGVGAPPGEAVTFRVVFNNAGNVTSVSVSPPWAGTPVDPCVVRAVSDAHVPPFSDPTWAMNFSLWLCC